ERHVHESPPQTVPLVPSFNYFDTPDSGSNNKDATKPPDVTVARNGWQAAVPDFYNVTESIHLDSFLIPHKVIANHVIQQKVFYGPGLILNELRKFDVRYAFAAFVERFGMQYSVLMRHGHPDHLRQRKYLEDIVGFLMEVDECGKGSSLPPEPLYDVLARSFE